MSVLNLENIINEKYLTDREIPKNDRRYFYNSHKTFRTGNIPKDLVVREYINKTIFSDDPECKEFYKEKGDQMVKMAKKKYKDCGNYYDPKTIVSFKRTYIQWFKEILEYIGNDNLEIDKKAYDNKGDLLDGYYSIRFRDNIDTVYIHTLENLAFYVCSDRKDLTMLQMPC